MPCLARFSVKSSGIRVPISAMRSATVALLERCGMDPAGASSTADVLITNDLRGNESHGVSNMLRQ